MLQRSALISRTHKILFTGVAVCACLLQVGVVTAAGAGAASQGDLQRAGLSQAGQDLIFTVRTASPVPLAQLDPLPAAGGAGSPHLCLVLSRGGSAGRRQICLGGKRGAHRHAGLELLNGAGRITAKSTIAARLKRAGPHKLALTLRPEAAGLAPHRYRWQVLESRGGCAAGGCQASLPARGTRPYRLRPVRPVGCAGGGPREIFNGPRGSRAVALTFDDGPSEYTEGFLDVLRREHVHGTFFEVGQEMAGREGTMRRILREGNEIGDHTMNHVEYPGYAQIAGAAGRIDASTHFKPCLFRPPGGAVDSSVIATAGGLGMETILWDVDPTDWATPGAAAVYSRVVGAAQPGSIVLMHDGGGDRSGTLAALPRIIDTLRGRGYRFDTVSRLLGQRLLYQPYG